MNWILNDLWLGKSKRWFVPPPLPLHFRYRNINSPMDSFFDFIYPVVDRLVRIDFQQL